jgi:hypothetical protein
VKVIRRSPTPYRPATPTAAAAPTGAAEAEAVLLRVGAATGARAEVVAAGGEGPAQAAASITVASATAIASVARISLDRRAADTTAAS